MKTIIRTWLHAMVALALLFSVASAETEKIAPMQSNEDIFL